MATEADVRAIYDRLRADPDLTPAEVRRGVRTEVHALLQVERPMPYLLPEPAPGKSHDDFKKRFKRAKSDADRKAIHDEEMQHYAERNVAMRTLVSMDDHVAYHRDRPPGVIDAHHYAQKRHGEALWKDADAWTDKVVPSEVA